MPEYIPTDKGADLAKATGLDALAQRLYDKDDQPLDVLTHIASERSTGFNSVREEYVNEGIVAARGVLKTGDETRAFDRALHLDVETSKWRHVGGLEEGTLFPVRSVLPYANAVETDGLVLSGAVGLSLSNFRNRYPLLARSRYQEYGFRTYNEACAFVGAYVTAKFIAMDTERFVRETPSFQYDDEGITHTLSVTGSLHGDFRMTETKAANDTSLSPADTWTEFGRPEGVGVAGYHSVEPDIVVALLEDQYLKTGKSGLEDLIREFETRVTKAVQTVEVENRADRSKNPFTVPFADYGSRDVQLSLVRLNLMMTRDDMDPFRYQEALHRSPYLPQSSTLFEIVQTESGVKFQNRNEKMDVGSVGIELGRERYGDLFGVLLSQALQVHGRTAPHQLADVVIQARKLLEDQE